MTNPFDDAESEFLVLVNNERQYSLWPAVVDVPAGWEIAHGSDTRQACVEFVESVWVDMRPQSLVQAMGE